MDLFRKEDLQALSGVPGPCLSIFLPMYRAGAETQQNAIRFKNMLRRAEDELEASGVRRPTAREMLEPGARMVVDDSFWQHQEDGLAVFCAQGFFRTYRVPLRLDERCSVGQRMYLKPLLPLFARDGRFYVLALSQNDVRLLEVTRDGASQVDLPGAPRSLAEALRFDDPERQLNLHIGTTTGTGAIFHGHGVGTDDSKDNIRRYFQQVEKGVHQVLRDRDEPLVVAAVEYLLPIYREVNTYAGLIDAGVSGNPEGLKPAELRDRALPVVEPHLEKGQREALAMFEEQRGTDRVSSDLAHIVPAAFQGRVDRLFFARGLERWGRFDPETNQAHVHAAPQNGDQDLMDFAAVQTVLKGGDVYALEPDRVPGGTDVGAIFRY